MDDGTTSVFEGILLRDAAYLIAAERVARPCRERGGT
jgi:hypothetical protein